MCMGTSLIPASTFDTSFDISQYTTSTQQAESRTGNLHLALLNKLPTQLTHAPRNEALSINDRQVTLRNSHKTLTRGGHGLVP
jgi:hypothetical protein